ncbi:hypothetical protein BC937DRAFT_90236 [Endogone sp. FLAS-F59071]|nr:hypothetical protein BC937DRAFT_90236 [Endogone sp. FLAS-F59071]|eukprot:RUS17243.1 hypothetical protein BC937DRAFT_90236 [Endogone sp. FLAS-F59071]
MADAPVQKKQHSKAPQKPDEKAYRKAIDESNLRINDLKKKLEDAKERLNNAPSGKGSANDKREELRNRLKDLQRQQAEIKQSKQGTFDQLNTLNAAVQKKINDLKASKDKYPYKTTAEVDSQIKDLEKKIQSGTLKLIEEKRIVADISALRKARKGVEAVQNQQSAIDADRQQIDELKKTTDDPNARAINKEYDEVKSQIDALQRDQQADRDKRNELFNEQTSIRQQLDEAYSSIRALRDEYKLKNDDYYAYQRQFQIQRREAILLRQQEIVEEKRQAAARDERESADIPAFEREIITCENLIKFLRPSAAATDSPPTTPTTPTANTNIRQPDASNAPQGTVLKKKSDREDEYFVGGKYAKKSKNQPKQAAATATTGSTGLKLPLEIMEAFYTIEVAIPTSAADVDRAIDALRARLAHYKAEQPKVTEEKKRKAEEKIAALLAKQEEKKQSRQNGAGAGVPPAAVRDEEAFADAIEVEKVTVEVSQE